MKKLNLLFVPIILFALVFVSCANSKTFTVPDENGQDVTFIAKPYGWANADDCKIEGVEYEVNVGNVVWDILLVETIVVPIYLSGWQLYEPVGLSTINPHKITIVDGVIKNKVEE